MNVNETVWQAVLDRERKGKDKVLAEGDELDLVDDETEEEDEEELELEDGWGEREFVSDVSGDEDEDEEGGLSDLEDAFVSGFFVCLWRTD